MNPSDPYGLNRVQEIMKQLQLQQSLPEAVRRLAEIQDQNLTEWLRSQPVVRNQFQRPLMDYLQQMDTIRQQNFAAIVRSLSGFENQWHTKLMNDQL